jgi:hypothetical protein
MAVVLRSKSGKLRLKRPPKYGNKKVIADGITFDSRKEWSRYTELQLALKSGLIKRLEIHPRFELVVNGIKVCNFVADFSYFEVFPSDSLNEVILTVEDVKSRPTMTPVYRLKKKLLRALWGIEVKEI